MRVIPVCPSLIGNREGVQERIVGCYWALVNAYRTVRPRSLLLKQTMPMLHDMNAKSNANQQDVFSNRDTHDARTPQHGRIRQLIDNIDFECLSLCSSGPVRPPNGCKEMLKHLVGCDHGPRKRRVSSLAASQHGPKKSAKMTLRIVPKLVNIQYTYERVKPSGAMSASCDDMQIGRRSNRRHGKEE